MCPFWIPVVTKERNAAKFCAKPATATNCISFLAFGFCNKSKAKPTKGCSDVKPPTVPRASGSSIHILKISFSILACVRLLYWPSLQAYACTAASTALKSLPVASITASIPFMIPLLCVTALLGVAFAIAMALTIF